MTETDSLSRAQKAVTYNDVPALTSSIDIMVAVLLNDWGAVRNPKSEQPVFFANQSGLLGPITKYAVELAKDDFHLLHAISALRAVIRMAVDGSPESNTALDHCLTLIKRHPQPDVRVAVLENAARDVEDRESEQKILEALLIEVTELHLAKLHSFDARLQAMVFVGDRGLNTLAHTETALTSAVTLLETADPNVKTAEAAFLITDLASRKFPGTPLSDRSVDVFVKHMDQVVDTEIQAGLYRLALEGTFPKSKLHAVATTKLQNLEKPLFEEPLHPQLREIVGTPKPPAP